MTYEKRIEVRWRDVDALRHVNNAVFLTYIEEARIAYLLRFDARVTDMILARDEDYGVRRALAPIAEARGFARGMLWTGAGLTLFFVVLAIFAPLISPYGFDQYSSGGHRFAQRHDPGRGRVAVVAVAHRLVGGLHHVVWRREVRLADAEVDHGAALRL